MIDPFYSTLRNCTDLPLLSGFQNKNIFRFSSMKIENPKIKTILVISVVVLAINLIAVGCFWKFFKRHAKKVDGQLPLPGLSTDNKQPKKEEQAVLADHSFPFSTLLKENPSVDRVQPAPPSLPDNASKEQKSDGKHSPDLVEAPCEKLPETLTIDPIEHASLDFDIQEPNPEKAKLLEACDLMPTYAKEIAERYLPAAGFYIQDSLKEKIAQLGPFESDYEKYEELCEELSQAFSPFYRALFNGVTSLEDPLNQKILILFSGHFAPLYRKNLARYYTDLFYLSVTRQVVRENKAETLMNELRKSPGLFDACIGPLMEKLVNQGLSEQVFSILSICPSEKDEKIRQHLAQLFFAKDKLIFALNASLELKGGERKEWMIKILDRFIELGELEWASSYAANPPRRLFTAVEEDEWLLKIGRACLKNRNMETAQYCADNMNYTVWKSQLLDEIREHA